MLMHETDSEDARKHHIRRLQDDFLSLKIGAQERGFTPRDNVAPQDPADIKRKQFTRKGDLIVTSHHPSRSTTATSLFRFGGLVDNETLYGLDGATLRSRVEACQPEAVDASAKKEKVARPPALFDRRFQITDDGFIDTGAILSLTGWNPVRSSVVEEAPATPPVKELPPMQADPPWRLPSEVPIEGGERTLRKKGKTGNKAGGEQSGELVRAEVLLKQKVRRSDQYQRVNLVRLRKAKSDQRLYERDIFERGGSTAHSSTCPSMSEKGGMRFSEDFGTLRTDYNSWSWRLYQKQHESNVTPTERLKEVIKLGATVKKSFRQYERTKLGLPPLLQDEKAQRQESDNKDKAVWELASKRFSQAAANRNGSSPGVIVVKEPWRPTSRELHQI
jgi:hypothetical protein